MGLPFAPIMTGFPGLSEPGAAHDAASPRTHTTTPSPFGKVSDAESAGTQTTASPQSDFGSDAQSQYHLSDAAILSLQLRAMQGRAGAPDAGPNNAARETSRSADGPQSAAPQTNQSTDGPLDLSSQESNLQSALESMGISPGAIQEFMYIGQVLAEAAPGLFQDFVAQVVNLADLYKQAQSPGAGIPVARGGDTKPQTKLQMISVEESQTSVSMTQTPSGETLSVSSQEEALTYVSFGGAPAGQQATPTAKSGTVASPKSSSPSVAPTTTAGSSAPAA